MSEHPVYPLYCGSCGLQMPGRPDRPGFAVCAGCHACIELTAPSDVFAIHVSDFELPTAVLAAVNAQRRRLRNGRVTEAAQ